MQLPSEARDSECFHVITGGQRPGFGCTASGAPRHASRQEAVTSCFQPPFSELRERPSYCPVVATSCCRRRSRGDSGARSLASPRPACVSFCKAAKSVAGASSTGGQETSTSLKSPLQRFPGDSGVNNLPANAEVSGSIPRSGRSPGGGNGNPFHYSCLENPLHRGAWRGAGHGVQRVGLGLATKQHQSYH